MENTSNSYEADGYTRRIGEQLHYTPGGQYSVVAAIQNLAEIVCLAIREMEEIKERLPATESEAKKASESQ